MRELKPVKFKEKEFYTNAKNFTRKEHGKEFRRLKLLLNRRINRLNNYRVPKKYNELLETYTRNLSNYELFSEVRHLYNILKKPDRFSQARLDARREELLDKFSEYGVTNDNYDFFFDFLDSVAAIMKEASYSSSEAIEYFESRFSGQAVDDDIDSDIVAKEFAAYIETLEAEESE